MRQLTLYVYDRDYIYDNEEIDIIILGHSNTGNNWYIDSEIDVY